MKNFKIFSVFLLCFAVGFSSLSAAPAKKGDGRKSVPEKNGGKKKAPEKNDGKKKAPEPPRGKKNSIENRLDSIVFKTINIKNIPMDQVLEWLEKRSARQHPTGKGVKITMVRGDRPEKGRSKLAQIPNITLVKKNLSLKQILDEISKSTKFKYVVKKGRVEFVRPYVARNKDKGRGKDKDKNKGKRK